MRTPIRWRSLAARAVQLSAPALLAALSTGCATMTNGSTQTIPISTSPPGARVNVNGQAYTSPCAVPLARNRDHSVVIEKPGYEQECYSLVRKPTGAVRGNIWYGGLIGWAVDSATGADNELVPDRIQTSLRPLARDDFGEQTIAWHPR